MQKIKLLNVLLFLFVVLTISNQVISDRLILIGPDGQNGQNGQDGGDAINGRGQDGQNGQNGQDGQDFVIFNAGH